LIDHLNWLSKAPGISYFRNICTAISVTDLVPGAQAHPTLSTDKRRPAMKKVSTVAAQASRKISAQKLTVGLDLGDRASWYCVLDEAYPD
jgi:hypothetical protein